MPFGQIFGFGARIALLALPFLDFLGARRRPFSSSSLRSDGNGYLTNAKACACVVSTKRTSKRFTMSNIIFIDKLIQPLTSYSLDEARVLRYEGIGILRVLVVTHVLVG